MSKSIFAEFEKDILKNEMIEFTKRQIIKNYEKIKLDMNQKGYSSIDLKHMTNDAYYDEALKKFKEENRK